MTKRLIYMIFPLLFALSCASGCKEHYITYNDDEYVMFADTAHVYVVREDIPYFEIPVTSTVICDYDRSFAVEVLDPLSTAVETRDFRLESNNFTIPAGKNTAYIKVYGNYDNLPEDKDMDLALSLVVPQQLVMPMYGTTTVAHIRKTCKFNRKDFTGWAVVSSMFLYQFSVTGAFQRLVYTEADPDNENGVIVRNCFVDGYDVKIAFDDDTDPANPAVGLPFAQVASDEAQIFGMVHGDNHILVENSNMGPSYFFCFKHVAVLVNRFYVENVGEDVGTVGHFLTEIDWVSDEEAERLRREDGM